MSLNMSGQIDGVFQSVAASFTPVTQTYVDGIPSIASGAPIPFVATIQPVSDRELDNLLQGGERITDARRIYVNDGPLDQITLQGNWEFLGQKWKILKLDNRPWRKYCKIIVSRYDDQ